MALFKKKTNNYVSNLDKFLEEKRAHLPESPSQRKEREKYEKIARLRDKPQDTPENKIWEGF